MAANAQRDLSSAPEGTSPATGLDTTVFGDIARKELVTMLGSIIGKKGLVLDPTLAGPLNRVADISFLKEHGVEKVYYLEPGAIQTDCGSFIYLCRPRMSHMRSIADNVRYHGDQRNITHNVFLVPRRTLICERILEQEGVMGNILAVDYWAAHLLGECHLDLFPLENDLLSLELEHTFKELYVDGDYSALYDVARAVMRLQTEYGFFPRILGKGNMAKLLTDMLVRMRQELAAQNSVVKEGASLSAQVDSLVIIDRAADLVSPLCTQLTYEGLVDEHYGIKNGYVDLDMHAGGAPITAGPSRSPDPTSSLSPGGSNGGRKRRVPLDARDPVHRRVRDLNFSAAATALKHFAKRLQENQEERHKAKSITEIREFAGRLSELQAEKQAIATHLNMMENVQNMVYTDAFRDYLEAQQALLDGQDTNTQNALAEELVDKQAPIERVLRLLSLQSLVNGGLKVKQYDFFRQEIVQTYGYEHMLTLQRLDKAGLFTAQGSARNHYPTLRKQLRLSVPDVDEHYPSDVAYVYSGYAPLSIRLVQCACRVPPRGMSGVSGWRGYEDALRLIPGETVDEAQRVEDGMSQQWTKRDARTTVVLFLGGCTFTEVSAIRFHAQKEQANRNYLILTTQMINGNTLMQSLLEKAQQTTAAQTSAS
ncbi:Sec1-like protein [Thamnocephalis sphaerospora]|uniref:Sec1-like protein n=1 Tax=Thamnocephalis sphaerospora TaxID=78915 RepID=A0A4P9XNC1_9FUNG|nr:Sec1-like protein [Thamnocephalis sphaerospora]|eukprot:RKP07426.1 Sec1-like protein [Thamnocephalis sphaerospora]